MYFLNDNIVRHIVSEYGSPVYVYDEKSILDSANKTLSFPHRHNLTVRFAMKSCPNSRILKILDEKGLHIDASSGYEALRAIQVGISPQKIQVTAQELPHNLEELVNLGVLFNACSLYQLESYGKQFPGKNISIRVNPGLGSGHSNRTNVGGPSSSFGIWWEYLGEVKEIASKYNLTINKIHTHIGSGSDPDIWTQVAVMSLETLKQFPDVVSLNLGGGFKIDRMNPANSTNLESVGSAILSAFEKFESETGRSIDLEIEPGTFLMGLNGAIISKVVDRVQTGKDGFLFYKINSGMTEVLRPSMYGAIHPISVVSANADSQEQGFEKAVIVGHCCESGDILTPKGGDPEGIEPREIKKAQIGDYLVIDGSGAYCSGMPAKNYNSFLEAPEVLVNKDGKLELIRKRQTMEQLLANELS